MNTSRDGDFSTPLGSLCHCLSTLAEKKWFLTQNLNLPWCNLKPLPLILSLLPGRRGQPPPHHNLLSGSCREGWGLPWASSSPDWTIPVPSATPHKTCAPDLSQFQCPSLDMLQGLKFFLLVKSPKLNTVLEVQPHQSWVQWDNHLPAPAGCTISDTGQNAIGFLAAWHTAGLCSSERQPTSPHSFPPLSVPATLPKALALPGVVVIKVKDLAVGLVEFHPTGLSLSIQPV